MEKLAEASILVTGFGPFDAIADNPTAKLAASLGLPFEVLPVTFEAVDYWHANTDPPQFLIHMGYANRKEISFERLARNQIGSHADVKGVSKPGPISDRAVANLSGNLWPETLIESLSDPLANWSVDAGTYLCNYIYFQSRIKWPQTRTGFIHVPDFTVASMDRTLAVIKRAIRLSIGIDF